MTQIKQHNNGAFTFVHTDASGRKYVAEGTTRQSAIAGCAALVRARTHIMKTQLEGRKCR